MKNQLLLSVGALNFVFYAHAARAPETMIVIDPVVDVRAEPKPHSKEYVHDPLQETQVEAGEPVIVIERKGKWARIECPQQEEYTHNGYWQGYPGWVPLKSLSKDMTRQKIIVPPAVYDDALRQKILTTARQHLGESYLWGGRSLHNPKSTATVTGVDCSGLVNRAYREAGWIIARDAHEQFLNARRIDSSRLKPADLIFLAKADKPEKIVHVALCIDRDTLIEAPQTGDVVREISFEKRFGARLLDLKNGEQVGDRVVYFGTLFPEKP